MADILSAARSRKFGARAQAAWAIALVGAGVGNIAHAQDASTSGDNSPALQVEEITVTGSRIKRTTDFDTANPTTVVDSSFLQNLGIVNAGDAVRQLPSNLSNNTPRTTGNANFFIGSTIANLRGLNPFFGSRTLTLLNNRRFVPTNQGDGVDLNFLPSIMIDRIDIVTGGVSAAYGSGAIAGVQNIFLSRKLEGGKVQVDYGQSSQSDGDDKHVGLAYGMGLFENRGHFVVGYEYENSDAVGCFNARDWCRKGNGFYSNAPGLDPTKNPQFLLGTDIRANQISTTGVFYRTTPGLTQTTQADAAGTGVLPFNLDANGSYRGSAANFVQGGDGRPVYQYTNLSSPVKRNVGAGTFTYELTDTMNLSVDVSYGKVETTNITGATDATNNRIFADNAFLSANLAAARTAAAAGGAFAQLNKDWTSQTNPHTDFTTDVKRAAIGLDGKFGDSTWSWDGYYQYGKTKREQFVADARRLTSYLMAIDSVKDAGGNTVCRVTRDGYTAASGVNTAYAGFDATTGAALAAGCSPLNPFGLGAISPQARAYAFGFLDEQLDYEQQAVATSASGDLISNGFGLGAGPIQGAIGAEYRKEKGVNQARQDTSDILRRDYPTQYGESFSGDVDVTEGFVEANLPVLTDASFAKKLEFNTAARISKYKNQGKGPDFTSATRNIFTWKVSSIWDPVDWLRFRGSQSRDSRSPNFRELYYQQVLAAGGPFSFCGPAGTNTDPCNFDLRGNVNLRPEKADATTFGLVLTPKDVVPGLQFAVDYFRIRVTDSINQGSSRVLLDSCNYGANPANCVGITTAVPGVYTDIVTIIPRAYNGVGYTYKGVDLTTTYLWQINDTNSINFRLLATHMIDQKYQTLPTLPEYQLVGQTGTANSFLTDYQSSPKWLGNLTATYNHGPLSVTGQGRFVGDGKFNYRGETPNPDGSYTFPLSGQFLSGATINVNHVPSYAVFGLSGSYSFENVGPTKNFAVFATVDNLFDRNPPIAAGNGANQNGGTNPIYFDTLGRFYRLGVRTNF